VGRLRVAAPLRRIDWHVGGRLTLPVQSLPIDTLLPEAVACLTKGSRLVLRAAPGAGKTTRVPAALLDAGLAGDKQVVVLEPRRIAARAAAEFVARERRGTVGGEVGYRVRFEQRGGAATRLWFVTEGVLGRQLTRDPFLERVGIVVLDEFHERHLQGDVALAVVRELQETVRADLKLVVMSATLETDRLAAYLGNCPALTSEGTVFPVQIEYDAQADERPLAGRVATAVRRVLANRDDGGDVLVFLPGAAEIRRAAEALAAMAAEHSLAVVPLHGDLPLDAQQRAIRRGERRKVVLSTNVAETALTIEGVTAVIDCGLARVARFDAKHGINALRIAPISRAAAAQRAGRAGRTAPGRCLRLWTQAAHQHRLERDVPEVVRLDLCGTVLELRAWGLRDVRGFGWLEAPAEGALQRAEHLLAQLGAVDVGGGLTAIGRRMLELSVPPRLARILVEAERAGCAEAGALLAALASERDICLAQRALTGDRAGPAARHAVGSSDLLVRMELFGEAARARFAPSACRTLRLEHRSVRAVERARRQLQRALGRGDQLVGDADEDLLLRCTLAGYPDRVVRRRNAGSARGVMVGGTGVVLMESSVVRDTELFVAVEVDAGRRGERSEARIRLASAVRAEWLPAMLPTSVRQRREVVFHPEQERVVVRVREQFHDLVLHERLDPAVDPSEAGTVLAEAARRDLGRAAHIGDTERVWLDRVRFLQQYMPELALPADVEALLVDAIVALCAGCRSFAETRAADLLGALGRQLTHQQRMALDREAPSRYRLPSGRAVAITYTGGKPPAAAARIQELFGLTGTPRLAAGRVPLVIELLAPNGRPVQITDDLESFWRTTYAEVRKQLRGRYPKHAWPEEPRGARPRAKV
jgi:ATP-dependent RNA helicase HrpB